MALDENEPVTVAFVADISPLESTVNLPPPILMLPPLILIHANVPDLMLSRSTTLIFAASSVPVVILDASRLPITPDAAVIVPVASLLASMDLAAILSADSVPAVMLEAFIFLTVITFASIVPAVSLLAVMLANHGIFNNGIVNGGLPGNV
ncbi:hypothetical protein ACFELR_00005, partial [Heyndrickxia coagulans]|uniref:hypothetical protein n=1 Tax=Heyndrickxia coagulans TaxID=1398 RepID=UPI003896D6B3